MTKERWEETKPMRKLGVGEIGGEEGMPEQRERDR